MAITKEKLTILLQDRLGISRQESRQLVERFFKIMQDTFQRSARQRLWEILGQTEKGPSGEEPSNQGEPDHKCSQGGGI